MKLRFDANQKYQLQAIEAVTGLFEGQPKVGSGEMVLELRHHGTIHAIPNRLDLDEEGLLANLRRVQEASGLAADEELRCIEGTIEGEDSTESVRFANFTVEMETGTGKTYVYVRTALELFQRYGMRKFIVVVPSVAIREGVLKTLQVTQEHFRDVYHSPTYRWSVYDSANLAQVRQFAQSDGLEIMVMTLASFNRAANVIRQTTDRLQGETPLRLVQAARPILILDEPQNMESPLSRQALASLNPLFALRYSATHRDVYNLVHRLTPYGAYRQGLVKRIEVAGMRQVDDENLPYVRVDGTSTEKHTVRARVTVHRLMAGGAVKEATVTVRLGDNLAEKANRSEYAAFVVEEINPGGGFVRFGNGVELRVGEATGEAREALWEAQIRYTVEEHFRKQRRWHGHGLKVLTLFFIDRVANYDAPDAPIRVLFDRCFAEVAAAFPDVCQDVWGTEEIDPAQVQAAYFAAHRTREGQVVYEDSATGEAEKDRQAYDLIMRDKERLLSLAEPVAFIFSHSALREGWDNPNVFQICTLNQTTSEMRKRQEIGRGVRLAVDQEGERVRDEQVNVLTVVANESYEQYVATLQGEYAEEYGEGDRPPKPERAGRRTVRLRKCYLLSDDFRELWKRIRHRTRYAVTIDSEKLIAETVADLDCATIPLPCIVVAKAGLAVGADDALDVVLVAGEATVLGLEAAGPLPNLVLLMEDLLQRTTPPLMVSRRTLLEVFRRTRQAAAALKNPFGFARVAVEALRSRLLQQLVDGIRYEKIGACYEMTQFLCELQEWPEYLVPAEKALYDQVIVQSCTERRFAEDLEHLPQVRLYVKLPRWFTVPTPLGEYNPDWAIVWEDPHAQPEPTERLYLVRETKASTDPLDLRLREAAKARCGERHFRDALAVDYRLVAEASQLP